MYGARRGKKPATSLVHVLRERGLVPSLFFPSEEFSTEPDVDIPSLKQPAYRDSHCRNALNAAVA